MRRKQAKSLSNDDHYKKERVELSKSVADAATGLCRKMLRYKGNYHFKCEIRLDFVYYHIYNFFQLIK